MNVTTIGIDLAKSVFSIHGTNPHGKLVVRKRLSRSKLLVFIAQLPPCLIGMEACSGAHYWAREMTRLGHQVRIIAPRFVVPYRKSSKNDPNDAEAICEAVGRPTMRFVPIKTADQQAVLCLHRIRRGLIKERTAQINQIRGLLAEFGLIMPQGRYAARQRIPDVLEDAENGLPMLARRLLDNVNQRIRQLDEEILAYDREIEAMARDDDQAKRLMAVPGIGPQTATAILASAPDPTQFKSARHFAAWLGLVSRQYSTGGKVRLGRITKRGDKYLRMLLIHGTRAGLAGLAEKNDPLSCWARALVARRGYKRAAVALAAKNARIVWALLMHQTDFRKPKTGSENN